MGPKGPYDMHIIEVSKYKDGKAVEHWAYLDGKEVMKMMSAGQPKADHMTADTVRAKK
jgi:predicted SnoaL-like aldol condensation-catalyzing enzyme